MCGKVLVLRVKEMSDSLAVTLKGDDGELKSYHLSFKLDPVSGMTYSELISKTYIPKKGLIRLFESN
jgi:hypothetical protein